jgi:tRNA A-37 threonylcarbamoyl transferase component Bud32
MNSIKVHEKYTHLTPFIKSLPNLFKKGKGKVIYKGRNELREFHVQGIDVVVKSFRKPNIANQIIYGTFRSSKAQRSYEHAELFLKAGIGTPEPIGYLTERTGFLFQRSYYVCLKSECPYTFYDLVKNDFPRYDEIVQAVAKVTALIHDKGYLHKDYSATNILFRDDKEEIKIEIIDLNRMYFGKIGIEKGCKNFDRLPQTDRILPILSQTYAQIRNLDPTECYNRMKEHMYKVE